MRSTKFIDFDKIYKAIYIKMPKKKCFSCNYIQCRCPPRNKCKKPLVQIEAICPPERIAPSLPLCMTWEIDFTFKVGSNVTPITFEATGLFNIKKGCLQSIASAFFAPDRAPTKDDLDQSTIILPVVGQAGSITGQVQIYGDNADYTASLTPYILETGKEVILLTNFIDTTADVSQPIQLIFVARLFYCACPSKRH